MKLEKFLIIQKFFTSIEQIKIGLNFIKDMNK